MVMVAVRRILAGARQACVTYAHTQAKFRTSGALSKIWLRFATLHAFPIGVIGSELVHNIKNWRLGFELMFKWGQSGDTGGGGVLYNLKIHELQMMKSLF